jgi:DNA polymerase I-like protein with 3'-5' exonuclease and polymerase domains
MPNFSKTRWNEIVDSYNMKYRGITKWQEDNISSVPGNGGALVSPSGRIYKIPQEMHRKYQTMVYKATCIKNYPVQGTATGDIVPLAMNLMWDRMDENPRDFMSTQWYGQVHDSMIFDTMPHEVKRTAFTGIKVFEDLPAIISDLWDVDFNLPLTGEATWGPTYADQCNSVMHEEGKWILKTR